MATVHTFLFYWTSGHEPLEYGRIDWFAVCDAYRKWQRRCGHRYAYHHIDAIDLQRIDAQVFHARAVMTSRGARCMALL